MKAPEEVNLFSFKSFWCDCRSPPLYVPLGTACRMITVKEKEEPLTRFKKKATSLQNSLHTNIEILFLFIYSIIHNDPVSHMLALTHSL